MPIKDMDAPPLPDDAMEHLKIHEELLKKLTVMSGIPEDHIYFLSKKPMTGIKFDFSKPGCDALFTDIDYQEEEEEIELEPITIEFSL